MISIEEYVPGGTPLMAEHDSPKFFAQALADLVRLAPSPSEVGPLSPGPSWVMWNHGGKGIWPPPDGLEIDLNGEPKVIWLDELSQRAKLLLNRSHEPIVVGHLDWISQNLRWKGKKLHVAHDWDSVTAESEAVIAGVSAAIFPWEGSPVAATIEEIRVFLSSYAEARGRQWSVTESEICWAAGLWVNAYDARIEVTQGKAGPVFARLVSDAGERLRLAGA